MKTTVAYLLPLAKVDAFRYAIFNDLSNRFRHFIGFLFYALPTPVRIARTLLLLLLVAAGATTAWGQNAIVAENALAGNPASEWQISGAGDLSIQGYATSISYNRGETARFKIKTPASAYTVRIYRLGYYQGLGARLQGTATITAALPQVQGACNTDATTGLVDCGNWDESAHWDIPATAVSGVYLARLTRTDNQGASHIVFIVRNDASTAALNFQTSDATWQAYNVYGDTNANGKSLYTGVTGGQASKVSYNRPFITRNGGGGGGAAEDWLFNAEYPMIRWLEANGYDLSYSTDVDTDLRGSLLAQHRVFLSVGHDEYWSGAARANVTAARKAGQHLAFFGGNEVYWKTRYENNYRTLVCYKEGTLGDNSCGTKCDPTPTWTGLWRDGCDFPSADGCRPENELSGQISYATTVGALTVPDTYKRLRFWRNTSVAALGSGATATLPAGTLGYEWDPEQAAYASAYPAGRMQLSETVLGGQTHHLSLYKHPSGAWVFGAGTVQWAWGLDANHDRGNAAPSLAMQQATVNLFADMGVQPTTPQPGLVAATASTDTQAPTVAITAPAAGASLPAGSAVTIVGTAADANAVGVVEVSTDGGSTWLPATGTTSWTYSWTPAATGPATIQSRAFDDSGNQSTPVSVAVTVTAAAPQVCPCTVFKPTDAPAGTLQNDGQAIELGLKFRATTAGYITGVRFYKQSGNTGTHVGQLYGGAGNLLAQATFSGETATGWQQVLFGAPVAIVAGTTYVVAYHSSAGNYSAANAGLATAVVNAPLRGLANGEDGPNGVYAYATTPTFPTASYQGSNYFVDVVFATTTGPDTTPPTITATTPANNATGVGISAPLSVTFSEPLDAATVSGSTVQLLRGSTPVAATVSYSAGSQTVTLVPASPLSYAASYALTVRGGSTDPRIKDLAGNALAASYSTAFTTLATPPPTLPSPTEGPGGPILVVSAAANPFSRFPVEILRAEGFNEFAARDITQLRADASQLNAYDVVVLGEMPLTAADVTMLTNWVTAGGTLVALRPDAQLAPLLGLTPASGTLSDKYLLVNNTSGPGVGVVAETMQFHGPADLYTLSGATSLAMLYSAAATATANPAVTQRLVGSSGGRAVAFTYDLARSVVYTRQGNPALAGAKHDGASGPIRSDDQFYPDWVDFNKITIPQADEQQRLLANILLQSPRKPLPRFWYLPRGLKAAVVMTGDDHGNNGTTGRFNHYLAQSPDNSAQAVADWRAVRGTSYIYPGTPITDAQAAAFEAQGFEISLHLNTNCDVWTPTSLRNFFDAQLPQLAAQLPSVPAPTTHRTHCISWSDWASQPKIEAERGMRLDANYYYWPQTWVQDRPGLFTGSGMPMRFADLDGTLIDCYQATTQLTDESGITYATHIAALLDNALGAKGYYGVFTANMHTDLEQAGTNSTEGSNDIVAAALARQVPVISARQMLTWLDGRNNSSFGALTWSGNQLSFTVSLWNNVRNLQGMLPLVAATGRLSSLAVNGAPVTYTTQTIKGVAYAFFPASSGSYVASYNQAACTPPTATLAAASAVCVGSPVALRLSAASGQGPYDLVVNSIAYTGVSVGQSFATLVPGEVSIWGNTGTPANPDGNDGQPIEVGTKFRASADGFVTGVRFYKGGSNTGTHVGSLWAATGGSPLATATFTSETASGWQEVRFSAPVAIVAGTTYIVSYYSPNGGFAITVGGLAQAISSGPLTALAAGTDGPNGVYKNNGGFPDGGNSTTTPSYWVDVLFVPAATPTPLSYALTSITDAGGCTATGSSLSTAQVAINPLPAGTLAVAGTPTAGQNIFLKFTPSAGAGAGPYGLVINGTTYAGITSGTAFDTGVQSASATRNTFFANTPPTTPAFNDNAAVEVGMRFRTNTAGQVTALRFYKGATNTGTHTGRLWSSAGVELASVVFTNETASGWQEMLLSTPVAIAAGASYVVSYFAPAGNYAYTAGTFNQDVTNGPLTAPQSTTAAPNGVYVYTATAGSFPTNSASGGNYGVDLVFVPGTSTTFTLTSIADAMSCLRQGTLQVLSTDAPLPVQLTAFTAVAEGPAAVRLAWATAQEVHNAGFTVERSLDGQVFAAVGTVPGAGTSNLTHRYSLLDSQLPAGVALLYYRLRQTDLDGTITYSPVRSVTLMGTPVLAQLLAYPNPARDAVRVQLLGPAQAAPLEIINSLGQVVSSQHAPAGGTEVLVPLPGLAAGLYIVRCGSLSQRLTIE